jgi:hypothetical protein
MIFPNRLLCETIIDAKMIIARIRDLEHDEKVGELVPEIS